VNEITMTLKVSSAFRDLLAALVKARAAELEELTGQRIALSASATLRWLVEKEAQERGLPIARVDDAMPKRPAAASVRPKASASRTPKKSKRA
jgi:hypothetical protein